MPTKAETARITAISEALVGALEAIRGRGREEYPPTFRKLAEQADGSPTVEQALEAAGKKPFKGRVLAFEPAKKGGKPAPDSWVYFQEDKALERELWDRKLAELAERMVRVLESQSRLGEDAYPSSFARLAELCGLRPSDKVIPKLIAHEHMARRAVVAVVKGKTPDSESPVLLVDDVPRSLPALVACALDRSRTGVDRTFTGKKLVKKLAPALRKPVEDALKKARIGDLALPPTVAWVAGARGEPLLFHVDDLHVSGPMRAAPREHRNGPPAPAEPPATRPPEPAPARSADDFATAFRAAFDQIDRGNGRSNLVKLAALRRALPQFDRASFDEGLRTLQSEDAFTLDAHEGFYEKLAPEDAEAGIRDAGSLLVYAIRK